MYKKYNIKLIILFFYEILLIFYEKNFVERKKNVIFVFLYTIENKFDFFINIIEIFNLMAHHASALKRIRQSRKRRIYNRANKKQLKLAIRNVREAKTYDEGVEMLKKAYSVLDKVSAKGIIHKNNAANKKSSLTAYVKKLQTN